MNKNSFDKFHSSTVALFYLFLFLVSIKFMQNLCLLFI